MPAAKTVPRMALKRLLVLLIGLVTITGFAAGCIVDNDDDDNGDGTDVNVDDGDDGDTTVVEDDDDPDNVFVETNDDGKGN